MSMLHLSFTWLPTGSKLKRLSEKIIIAVVIGKQATQNKMNGLRNLSIDSINYLAAKREQRPKCIAALYSLYGEPRFSRRLLDAFGYVVIRFSHSIHNEHISSQSRLTRTIS